MTDPLTMLEDIPALAAEVAETRDAPNPGMRPGRHVRPAPGPKPPTNLASLHALMAAAQGGLRAELVTSVRLIVDEMADDPGIATDAIPDWPADTWDDLCQWLTDTAWWWQRQPWAGDVEGTPRSQHEPATGLRKVWGELRDLARVPRPLVIPCPTCGATMQPIDGGHMMQCTEGHEESANLEQQWRFKPAAPIAEVADKLKMPEKTIRTWIRRRKLKTTDDGRVWPWDALLLRHPDIADAIAARDTQRAG